MSAAKVEEFISVDPARYSFLSRVAFYKAFCDDGSYKGRVELRLVEAPRPNVSGLTLTLFDAVDVKIGNVNASVCVLVSILDISGWGWRANATGWWTTKARPSQCHAVTSSFR